VTRVLRCTYAAARRPGAAAAARDFVPAVRAMLAAMVSRTADRLGPVADWWRSRPTAVRDGAVAVVLAAAGFIPALSGVSAQFGDLPRRPGDVFAVLLVLGETLPLATRTRRPVVSLTVAGASFAVHESLGYPPSFGSLGVYLALYSAGAWQEGLRRTLAAAATAAYVLFSVVLHVLGSPESLVDFVVFYLALTVFWTAGAFMRRRRAEEAERRRLAARDATATERSRIARELHDVVTHHVTAMVVQADAAQFLAVAPDRVTESLTAISGTGRRALTELRYLLGILEATGEHAPVGRTPALGTLRDLVEQTRMGGQPVEFVEEGVQPALVVGAELAVYRVVQEALTNAVKHAAGRPTVVRVGYRPDAVEIEVTTAGAAVPAGISAGGPAANSASVLAPASTPVSALASAPAPAGISAPASAPDLALATAGISAPASAAISASASAPTLTSSARGVLQPPGGRGLNGLRERVVMVGGELVAEAQVDGGFRVYARIPAGSGS
jgi:signal transduction histidine kinase